MKGEMIRDDADQMVAQGDAIPPRLRKPKRAKRGEGRKPRKGARRK